MLFLINLLSGEAKVGIESSDINVKCVPPISILLLSVGNSIKSKLIPKITYMLAVLHDRSTHGLNY